MRLLKAEDSRTWINHEFPFFGVAMFGFHESEGRKKNDPKDPVPTHARKPIFRLVKRFLRVDTHRKLDTILLQKFMISDSSQATYEIW